MKKQIENAILKPDHNYSTRAGKSRFDYHEGDIVQVTKPKLKYAGRIGVIIGIQYCEKTYNLLYTIKFTDNESTRLPASHFRILSNENKHSDPEQNEPEEEC